MESLILLFTGAERTLRNIIPFIDGKLFMKVNRGKTSVAHISKVKYLGEIVVNQLKSKLEAKVIYDMYHNMYSLNQIAKQFGVRRHTVGKVLKNHGGTPETVGLYNKLFNNSHNLADRDKWHQHKLRHPVFDKA